MTEPREPDSTLDDGEPTRTIEAQKTEPASWYPVDARPDVEPPVPDGAPEPAPEVEPVAAGLEDQPPAAESVTADAEPRVEAVEEPVAEPQAVVEPEPEPTEVVEPDAVEPHPEPATVEPEPEPEPQPVAVAPAAAEEETVVVAVDSVQTLGDAEPTVATEVPAQDVQAEETVALAQPVEVEPTAVLAQAPVPTTPVPSGPTESIFRQPSPVSSPDFEQTRMEQLSDEEQKLAAERAARRDARATALAASAPMPLLAPEPVIVHKRTNDKFWGSVGLFLLRLVLAAILAVRGLNLLTDIPAAQASFAKTIIPYPGIMAIVTGVAALLIALSLVLGLLTRVAGLGIALIGGGALAFVYWGNWSPFIAGRPGFLGDYELLLAAVGVLLLCIGAGGWSLDRSIRAGRERNKAERASAAS